MDAVSAKGLSKTYWFFEKEAGLSGSLKALFRGKKVYVKAVREIDLRLEIGEIVGFIGPNGAGKTTTLKMLSGILHPTEGSVEVMGHVPFRREKEFLKKITYMTGQRNRLFWDLPAEEYFNFSRVMYEIPESDYRRNLGALIEMAGIGDIIKVPQRKLSAGQRKRCELVAAFLHDPRVVFLDEPTNALDLLNARRIREFIRERGKSGNCSIILTSHSMADIEQVCERIVVMSAGKIVHDGSIGELRARAGVRKRIRVVFDGAWERAPLEEFGEVRSAGGQEVSLEVESSRAASVASLLFSKFPVKDIEIADLPLERVIESIYLKGPS